MNATTLAQDFILPALALADIHNHQRVTADTQWSVTSSETEYLTHRYHGKPAFEAGGVFFTGS